MEYIGACAWDSKPGTNPLLPVDLPSDAELLPRLRNGDQGAYRQLTTQYMPRMLAIARRYLRDEADAQDAVQDAFISAFKAIAQFTGQSSIGTWLHTITVRAALMKLRSQRRRNDEVSVEDLLPKFASDGHHTDPVAKWKSTTDDSVIVNENRDIVRKCIDRLPEMYRSVLIMRDIDGYSTEETSDMLQIEISAVKTRLHRARQALRELLTPYYKE